VIAQVAARIARATATGACHFLVFRQVPVGNRRVLPVDVAFLDRFHLQGACFRIRVFHQLFVVGDVEMAVGQGNAEAVECAIALQHVA
jgi:ribosomal protein S5